MEKPGEVVVEDRDEYCRPGEIKPIKKLPIFKLKSVKIDKIEDRKRKLMAISTLSSRSSSTSAGSSPTTSSTTTSTSTGGRDQSDQSVFRGESKTTAREYLFGSTSMKEYTGTTVKDMVAMFEGSNMRESMTPSPSVNKPNQVDIF